MPRVKLIQNKTDVAPEHYALFDELAALRGRISGPSSVVLHSPAIARAWNEISEYLHGESVVEPEAAELAVSVAARECDCSYVYNAHVPSARRAGVSEAALAAVRENGPPGGASDEEAAVIDFTRQLLRTNRVDSTRFDQLLKAHDAKWLVELTVWIGRYAALACVLNAFEVLPENPTEAFPSNGTEPSRPSGPVSAPRPSPRIEPVTRAEDGAPVGGPAGILGHSPLLAARVSDVTTYLRNDSLLDPPTRELAMLATAREKDCSYVWAAHTEIARQAGVSDEVITAVANRRDLSDRPPAGRDLVDCVRMLHRRHRVTSDLFDRLIQEQGSPWLVELTCLTGHYGLLAAVVNAFEVGPAAGSDELPLS